MVDYTYSAARVRAKENSLLTGRDFSELIAAHDFNNAKRILRDKGFYDGEDVTEIIDGEEQALDTFLAEIADENIMRFLRLSVDYHNIKASVKSVFSNIDGRELLKDGGTEDKETIYSAAENREYSMLNKETAMAEEGASSILLRTQDGQLCDIYTDNKMLQAADAAAKACNDKFIKEYADVSADLTNLKTALRCAVNEKDREFIKNAVFDGGTLNTESLIIAAGSGVEALCEYIRKTEYAYGAEAAVRGAETFEKWCDEFVMDFIHQAKNEYFTAAPIIAYAHAKRTELNMLRIILSAKQNMIDNALIRERVLYE